MILNREILGKEHDSRYPLCFSNFFEADRSIALEVSSLEYEEWDPIEGGISGTFGISGVKEVPQKAVYTPGLIRAAMSAEMLDFVSQLAHAPMKLKGIAFQKWNVGDSLGPHSDSTHSATIVLYLSPYWKPSWGGILEFSHKGGPWGAVTVPKFGTASFCLADADWEHQVTPVKPAAPIPRLAAVIRYKKKKETA